MEKQTRLQKLLRIFPILLALLLVTALVVWMGVSGDGEASESANTDPVATAPEDISNLAEQARKLTVTTVTEDAECAVDDDGLVVFDIGTLKGIPPRQDSDSLETPVEATEPEPARDEVQETICRNPLHGVTTLVFFATDVRDYVLARSGVDILPLNVNEELGWDLSRFAVDPSQINVLAAEYMPLLDVEPEFKTDCEVPDGEDPSVCWTDSYRQLALKAIAKNHEWQTLAGLTGSLLDKFVAEFGAPQSVVNYHLVAGGLVVGGLPAVERNPKQEDLPALVLSSTEKDQCEVLVLIGFNMGDQRPELFEPRVCEAPTPTTVPPTTVPPCETCSTTTTTVPPPCETCTTTTTTTVPETTTTTSTVPESATTTTVPQCEGDKPRWDPELGRCMPPFHGGTTLPPPPVTAATSTTAYQPPTPPSTAAPDTLPPGVTPTTHQPDPPVVTHVPPGGTETTVPHTTVAPAPAPPNTEPSTVTSVASP